MSAPLWAALLFTMAVIGGSAGSRAGGGFRERRRLTIFGAAAVALVAIEGALAGEPGFSLVVTTAYVLAFSAAAAHSIAKRKREEVANDER